MIKRLICSALAALMLLACCTACDGDAFSVSIDSGAIVWSIEACHR